MNQGSLVQSMTWQCLIYKGMLWGLFSASVQVLSHHVRVVSTHPPSDGRQLLPQSLASRTSTHTLTSPCPGTYTSLSVQPWLLAGEGPYKWVLLSDCATPFPRSLPHPALTTLSSRLCFGLREELVPYMRCLLFNSDMRGARRAL